MHQVLETSEKFQTHSLTRLRGLKMQGSEGTMADNLNGLNILPPIVRGAPSIRSIKLTKLKKSKHLKGRSRELVRHNLFDP